MGNAVTTVLGGQAKQQKASDFLDEKLVSCFMEIMLSASPVRILVFVRVRRYLHPQAELLKVVPVSQALNCPLACA